jgi:hypothetical protein
MNTSGMRSAQPKRANGAAFDETRGLTPLGDAGEAEDPALVSASVAKHMLALIEMMVPRVVSLTVESLKKSEADQAETLKLMATAIADATVSSMVPRVVATTVATMQGRERRSPGEQKRVTTSDDHQQLNGMELATAMNCGEWLIYAVKKANRIFAAQGKEPLIFTGRYSSPAAIAQWLKVHPDFVPTRVLAPNHQHGRRKGGVA